MADVNDGAIALTVTSPPYWNAIDYNSHAEDATRNYRHRQNTDPYDAYLDFLDRAFGEVLRVTRPGGFCAVVIGTVLHQGVHTPLPYHLVGRMERLGFQFHQDIIWSKVTGGVKRARVTIQHPYPGYYYPNLMTELILVFTKPGEKLYVSRDKQQRDNSRIPTDTYVFKSDTANNIWHIAPVPPNQHPHPCPFPEEIPHRLIELYTYRGDVVLDPFAGIGSTLVAAKALDRHYIGYEIEPQYIETTQQRLKQAYHRRQQLITRYEKLDAAATRP